MGASKLDLLIKLFFHYVREGFLTFVLSFSYTVGEFIG